MCTLLSEVFGVTLTDKSVCPTWLPYSVTGLTSAKQTLDTGLHDCYVQGMPQKSWRSLKIISPVLDRVLGKNNFSSVRSYFWGKIQRIKHFSLQRHGSNLAKQQSSAGQQSNIIAPLHSQLTLTTNANYSSRRPLTLIAGSQSTTGGRYVMHSGSHDKKGYLKKKTRNDKNTATTLKITTENLKNLNSPKNTLLRYVFLT